MQQANCVWFQPASPRALTATNVAENTLVDCTDSVLKPIRTATTQCTAAAMIALPPIDIRRARGQAVKPQAGKRKASDTGGVGVRPWNNAKSRTDNTDAIEAIQLDAADVMTKALKGTHVNKVNAEEIEDSDDDTTGQARGAPPAYVELSSHLVFLESAAEACGNGDAPFYLQKANMSFINTHASKPVQEADMRQFCEPQQGRPRGGTQRRNVV